MELRSGYKQTEVGVIPEDWDVSLINSLAETSSGTTPSRSAFDRYFKGGSIPWIKTLDLNNSVIKSTDECVTETALKETSLKVYPSGSVLVAMYGGYAQIGRTGLIIFPATVNQALTVISPNTRKLDPNFLLYVLNYKVDYWKSVASSSRKDPNITGNDVRNFPIAVPLVEEQRAIAAALSDVDMLLDGLERLIAKKRDLKQAAMQQLLTGQTRLPQFAQLENGQPKWFKPSELGIIPEDWEVTRLLDKVTLIHGKAHEPFVDDTGQFIVVNSKFISTEGSVVKHCNKNECYAQIRDVLMVLSDLPNGKALAKCFHVEANNKYAVNQRVCIYRTSQLDSKYLFYVLNRYKYFLALDDGVTQTHILNGDIAACQLITPKQKDEQTAIATILSDMDAELAALEARRDKTRALKQGMMQELLTGKTRLL